MPHMTIDAAGNERPEIVVGQTYPFYSDCVECKADDGTLIRRFSAQSVTVVAQEFGPDSPDWIEGQSEPSYRVRAANGTEFTAWIGELNGWVFDTGQWVGPRIF